MELIKGKTESGFEYTVDPEKSDNYHLTKAIAAVEVDGNWLMLPKVIDLLLGSEQAVELEKHIENEHGVIKHELLMQELADIFSSNSTLKK